MKNVSACMLIVLAVLLIEPHPAHAYLDPGSGSYAAQALFASALVGLVGLKATFRHFVGFLARMRKGQGR